MAQSEAAKARQKRYREKRKVEKYGPAAAGVNMSGRHGNHARGERNARWNGGRWRHQDGYIGIAVPEGHHLRQAHGYAYEHDLVLEEKLGRRLQPHEVAHHINGVRDDNRPENLEVKTRAGHALDHIQERPRDEYGRVTDRSLPPPLRDPMTGRMLGGYRPGNKLEDLPEDLRFREFPEVGA